MLHILWLPHTRISKEFSPCAFTQKIVKFLKILDLIGYEYTVYAPEWGEYEVVNCMDARVWDHLYKGNIKENQYDRDNKHWWQLFTQNAIKEINARKKQWDLMIVTYWLLQQPILDWTGLPGMELGIGYEGACDNTYKVWESYAWKNYISGKRWRQPNDYDCVIPNYFDLDDFPENTQWVRDYVCFVWRLNHDKWPQVAVDVAKKYGIKIKIAGQKGNREIDPYAEYVWVVDQKQRWELMRNARAIFVPSQYHEPFGGVAVEALLCWTPVISSDNWWLQDIVIHWENWFRCRSFCDYYKALHSIDFIHNDYCRTSWEDYSLDNISRMYKKQLDKVIDHINWWSRYSYDFTTQ